MAIEPVRIGNRLVGPGHPCYIVAETGINHNGDLEIARKLISAAHFAGCDAVKFQKRAIEVVYSPEELAKPRESPFGTTNEELKRALEFGQDEYEVIHKYCRMIGIPWYASCFDEASLDFIAQFDPPCFKIDSSSLTDEALLRQHREYGKPIILSTGMGAIEQIDHAVEVLGTDDLILLHCTSTYPSELEELNLRAIQALADRYEVPAGYAGHEVGLSPSLAATVLGACMVERHITLDRAMWGSEQAASVEPHGIGRLVRDMRAVESAVGDGLKQVYERELPVLARFRRVP